MANMKLVCEINHLILKLKVPVYNWSFDRRLEVKKTCNRWCNVNQIFNFKPVTDRPAIYFILKVRNVYSMFHVSVK